MEASTLELTVLSCQGLGAFNFFQKVSPYAAVSIVSDRPDSSDGGNWPSQRQKTPVDRAGNRKPEWNHALTFDLGPYKSSHGGEKYPEDFFVMFELRCKGTVFQNRTIGEVRVPLSDLIGEFRGARRFLSYQVRTIHGRANGVLNFSYKVNGIGKFMCTNTTSYPAVQESKYPLPEAIPVKPKDISYPSIDIDDILPPPLVPPSPMRQTVPYDNVFYAGNRDGCTYEPYEPVPGPGQYPSRMEVTGYGYSYYLWGNNLHDRLWV